ncbi:hypothetical protein ABIC83_002621 [Roseateles asaccharophilus]|uniref:hypothetical protein n=1 Tax=Roseateles asaccharophilus TaxID=582607 RepID=UPI0038375C0A
MADKDTTQGEEPTGLRGAMRSVGRDYRAFRRKGFFARQAEVAAIGRQTEVLGETKNIIKRALAMRVRPGRVEAFEAAVARLGLSQEELDAKMNGHMRTQWLLYSVASALIVYAWWLTLNSGLIPGVTALVASIGPIVSGYVHGFRAWQIQNRNLIKLQDALRIPGTYLVL